MTVGYTSYEALAVSYAINMLGDINFTGLYTALRSAAVRRDKSINYFDGTYDQSDQALWTRVPTISVNYGQTDSDGNAYATLVDKTVFTLSPSACLAQTQYIPAGTYIVSVEAKPNSNNVQTIIVYDASGNYSQMNFSTLTGASAIVFGSGITACGTVAKANGYYQGWAQFTATAGRYTVQFHPARANLVSDINTSGLLGSAIFAKPMWKANATATPDAYVAVPAYTSSDIVIESVGGLTSDQYTSIGGTLYADDFFRAVAVVDPSSPAMPQEIALHTYGYSGSIDIGWHFYIDPADAPSESLRRVRNTAGAIRADVEAQFGQPSCLQRGTVRIGQTYILDETKYLRGYAFVPMTIDWTSP